MRSALSLNLPFEAPPWALSNPLPLWRTTLPSGREVGAQLPNVTEPSPISTKPDQKKGWAVSGAS